jgi:hypothetical protein
MSQTEACDIREHNQLLSDFTGFSQNLNLRHNNCRDRATPMQGEPVVWAQKVKLRHAKATKAQWLPSGIQTCG